MMADTAKTIVSGALPTPEVPAPSGVLPVSPVPDLTLEAELGRGGMGVVYRARQTYLDRIVALKLLLIQGGPGEQEFLRRFQREAKILASLGHPHIVGCYQAGLTIGGQPYLVMEYIDGPDLRKWVDMHGPLDQRAALAIIRDLAQALGHAHRNGIIHRDVKPENVLLARQPDGATQEFPMIAKLADLGLARPTHAGGDMNLTRQGTIMGSPATMAPEQFDDPDNVDFRADIYGLGCVLYHALTGQPAFTGAGIAHLVTAKLHQAPPNPTQIRPSIPGAVGDFTCSLLASDRNHRPASYEAVIGRCQELLAGISAPRRSAWKAVAGVAAALVVVGGIAAVVAKPQAVVLPPPAVAVAAPAAPVAPVASVAAPPVDLTALGATAWGASQDLWNFDQFRRLQEWALASGAVWVSSDSLENAITGQRGRVRRPLPGVGPWRITGVLHLANEPDHKSESVQVGVLQPDGTAVSLNVINLGAIFHSQVNTYTVTDEEQPLRTIGPLALKPSKDLAFELRVSHDALWAAVGGVVVDRPALLEARPTAIYLGVLAGGQAAPVEVSGLTVSTLK